MNAPRALAPAVLTSGTLMLLGGLVLGGCGGTVADGRTSSAPAGGALAASTGVACTTGARSVCLTRSADGRAVTVGVGWAVGVDLHTPDGAWSVPSELGARLLRQIGGVRRDGGAVEIAYRAIAPGRTELRALERPVCQPGRMCPQFILLWQVHIHVTGR